jgi:hypothetical protein
MTWLVGPLSRSAINRRWGPVVSNEVQLPQPPPTVLTQIRSRGCTVSDGKPPPDFTAPVPPPPPVSTATPTVAAMRRSSLMNQQRQGAPPMVRCFLPLCLYLDLSDLCDALLDSFQIPKNYPTDLHLERSKDSNSLENFSMVALPTSH